MSKEKNQKKTRHIRPHFTVVVDGETVVGPKAVDLTDEEAAQNEHKLEAPGFKPKVPGKSDDDSSSGKEDKKKDQKENGSDKKSDGKPEGKDK